MILLQGQVAERSIATDCKSVVLWTSGVRIPPCPLAHVAQAAEHVFGKDEVRSASLRVGS